MVQIKHLLSDPAPMNLLLPIPSDISPVFLSIYTLIPHPHPYPLRALRQGTNPFRPSSDVLRVYRLLRPRVRDQPNVLADL